MCLLRLARKPQNRVSMRRAEGTTDGGFRHEKIQFERDPGFRHARYVPFEESSAPIHVKCLSGGGYRIVPRASPFYFSTRVRCSQWRSHLGRSAACCTSSQLRSPPSSAQRPGSSLSSQTRPALLQRAGFSCTGNATRAHAGLCHQVSKGRVGERR